MLQDRNCRQCRRSFIGGPRAYYCNACRYERRLQADRERKERARKGLTRKFGSIDKCERCGNEYEVNASLQKYCPDCQPIHSLEYDRKRKKLSQYAMHVEGNTLGHSNEQRGKNKCV